MNCNSQIVRWAFLASLALPLVCVFVILITAGHHGPQALLLTGYTVLMVWLVGLAAERGWPMEVFLLLATLHLAVLTPELLLRLNEFRYESGIRLGDRHPLRFVRLIEDEGLFWRLPADLAGVNSEGFKSRELPTSSNSESEHRGSGREVVRVFFQGDSVTFQGYPEMAELLLNRDLKDSRHYEVFNFSLAGYSSYQGRRIVERLGAKADFNTAFIAYGWNDHWLAWGPPDHAMVVKEPASSAARSAAWLYRHLRVAQALRFLVERPPTLDQRSLRVPADRFRDNLEFLGNFWRERGVEPIFMTLPNCHRHCGVPDLLVDDLYARDKQSVITLHRAYTQIIREVAGRRDWSLLDLEKEVNSLPRQDQHSLFIEDGFHLSPAGLALFAERSAAAIRDRALDGETSRHLPLVSRAQ